MAPEIEMRAYLSRWVCVDVVGNLRRLEAECVRAQAAGADLVVFPELFLTGYTRVLDSTRIREAFSALSDAVPGALFVFGSLSEEEHNRVTVWLAGEQVAVYDKVHLFEPNEEHERWRPGDRYTAVRWRGITIGLMNCNDVRYPEQARCLRLQAECDLLVVPAWWPWRRDHVWAALLRARAIENACWALGCCIAGSVAPGEEFAGAGNHVFDPAGEPVRTVDDRCYVLELRTPPEVVVDPLQQAPRVVPVDVVRAGR